MKENVLLPCLNNARVKAEKYGKLHKNGKK
jgi:hypothetical protein